MYGYLNMPAAPPRMVRAAEEQLWLGALARGWSLGETFSEVVPDSSGARKRLWHALERAAPGRRRVLLPSATHFASHRLAQLLFRESLESILATDVVVLDEAVPGTSDESW